MDESREDDNPEIEEGEQRKGQADALIVFGFGIKDPNRMQKQKEAEEAGLDPEEVTDQLTGWMLSLGGKMRVQAAAELYLRGAAREIIFTGGATRTKDGITETEAQVMEEYFLHILKKRKFEELKDSIGKLEGAILELSDTQKRDMRNAADVYADNARAHIIKEDKATNTIQNFSRTLSMFDKNPDKYKSTILLTSHFHAARVGQLAEQFLLKGEKMGAEDVMLATRSDKRHGQMLYNIIQRLTDPNTNEEYRKWLMGENRWSGGLKKVPEYFLPDTIHVDGERFQEILKSIASAEKVYEEKLLEVGIDPARLDEEGAYTDEELKEKIGLIERKLPPEEWASPLADRISPTPPFNNERRSEFTDSLQRAQHAKEIIFSDVDGTLMEYGTNGDSIGKYLQLVERCSGMVVMTSSKSRGDLERLRSQYQISELNPVIFENGAGVAINKKLINIAFLRQVAFNHGFHNLNFTEEENDILVEFSPPKEELRGKFDQVVGELGLNPRYVADMSVEEIAKTYATSLEEAQKVKDNHPEARKYFMHNFIFDSEPDAQMIGQLQEKAKEAGLHLTRARLTWHLMSDNVNKGRAVAFVQAILKNISNDYVESVGLGDAPNDYEMFEACDRSFLVSDEVNAPVNTLKTAQKGPDGVIEVIKDIFLKKENE